MKLKLSRKDAVVLKSVLSQHAFAASRYRQAESDVCVSLIKQLSVRMAKL